LAQESTGQTIAEICRRLGVNAPTIQEPSNLSDVSHRVNRLLPEEQELITTSPDDGVALIDPPDDDPAWLDADRQRWFLSRLAWIGRDHAAVLERYQSMRGTSYLSASESGPHRDEPGTLVFLREDKVDCLLLPNGGNARRWIVRVPAVRWLYRHGVGPAATSATESRLSRYPHASDMTRIRPESVSSTCLPKGDLN
jgi:hypothetical protein